jgi:hypothetical protein
MPPRSCPRVSFASVVDDLAPDVLCRRVAEDDVAVDVHDDDADRQGIEHQPNKALAS